MFQKKSDSIRDLIKFYESGHSQATRPSVKRCSTISSYNLAERPLSSSSNLDKSSTSSYSSKSSSSMSLSGEDSRKIDFSYVSGSFKENCKPLKRTETFSGSHEHSLRAPSVTNSANLSKRKSMSFYLSKTSVKNDQSSAKSLTRTSSTGLSSNVKKFDPRSVQKMVLEWCQSRTRSYKNVVITNFSSSWADGMAFCALIHSYMPEAFDFNKLSSQNRRYNLQLAFDVAYKRANIIPLLEVNDMILMGNRPDDRCIYTYLSTIYSKFHSAKHRTQNLEEIKEHVK